MSENIWGATRAEWKAFAALCKPDIRPCVMNPGLMTLPTKARPVSVPAKAEFSKYPSRIYAGNLVSGMPGWQAMDANDDDIESWSNNPDLGCGFVGRTIKAIDIDIDDEALSEEVDAAIGEFFGEFLPQRRRVKSSRRMLLYRLTEPDVGRKKVVIHPQEGGAIEMLFDRSFFVLAGTHKSGNRQYWPDGIPASLEEIPAISIERLQDLIRFLFEEFKCEGGLNLDEGTQEIIERSDDQVDRNHATYKAVVESDYFRDHLPGGQISVKCPWWESHTDGVEYPEDLTITTVLPVGLGGLNNLMGFKCMHVSHGPKTGAEFLDAIGYGAEEFPIEADVTEAQVTRPAFTDVSKSGKISPHENNLQVALEWIEGMGLEIAYDNFKGDIMIRPVPGNDWRPFTDRDYYSLAMGLLTMGFMSVPEVKLRAAVGFVAWKRQRDSAQEWLNHLRWDGVDRISAFHRDILHAEDSPYAQAVVNYMFTAMAGRVLSPGIKADMIPVLVGRQGVRKSTFVHGLAPDEDWAVDVDLSGRDADTSRQLRGKVIAELAELRGLGTRDEDSIKAWVTRTHEEWVPKFKEYANKYPRRFVMIGSVNHRRFLADATGERRWLPLEVCNHADYIEVEYVKRNREQLWAQAADMFQANGIMWQDAERLAKDQHSKFSKRNLTAMTIERWIHETGMGEFTTYEVAEKCLRVDVRSTGISKVSYTIERALLSLGYAENENGNWHLPFL